MPGASLQLTSIHTGGFAPFSAVVWPEAAERLPTMLLVHGPNGVGKSRLAAWLLAGLELLVSELPARAPAIIEGSEGWFDLEIRPHEPEGAPPVSWRFLVGDMTAWRVNATPRTAGFLRLPGGLVPSRIGAPIPVDQHDAGVLFFPERGRDCHPKTRDRHTLPQWRHDHHWVFRWAPPTRWESSLEAMLSAAVREHNRADPADGEPGPTGPFALIDQCFAALTDGRRGLAWVSGHARVRSAERDELHGLDELGTGEAQLLLLATELVMRWTPGSLVILDEPALGLDPSAQARLWALLDGLREERGGQVIALTRSVDLWDVVPTDSRQRLSPPRVA